MIKDKIIRLLNKLWMGCFELNNSLKNIKADSNRQKNAQRIKSRTQNTVHAIDQEINILEIDKQREDQYQCSNENRIFYDLSRSETVY